MFKEPGPTPPRFHRATAPDLSIEDIFQMVLMGSEIHMSRKYMRHLYKRPRAQVTQPSNALVQLMLQVGDGVVRLLHRVAQALINAF